MKRFILTLAVAFIFTFLFGNYPLSINLLIFNILILSVIGYEYRQNFKNRLFQVLFGGTFLSSAMVIIHFTSLAITMNIISLILLTGFVAFPKTKSMLTAIGNSFSNIILAFQRMKSELETVTIKGVKLYKVIRILKITVLPIIIIFIFIGLYSISNLKFANLTDSFFNAISDFLEWAFYFISFDTFMRFLLGIFIAIYAIYPKANSELTAYESRSNDILARVRRKRHFKNTSLKTELKSGIFLLIVLNTILLIVNIIDINWVWINFKWEGEYLRQFVHEGTSVLIFTILISIALILYYFRGNQNFYSKSRFLKILSYIWLAQNAILTISVAIRNFRYIEHFALAYKRIGVLIFLALTLYGIYTVFLKLKQRKSGYYLFRTNLLAVYLILITATFVDWDMLIVKYNFSKYQTSFIHYDFLAEMPEKCLPLLVKSDTELAVIDNAQKNVFSFNYRYMTSKEYQERIIDRRNYFLSHYKNRSWLSWNLPEYLAYRRLTGQ